MNYRSRIEEYTNNNNRIAVMETKLMPREYKMHSTFTIYCTALEFAKEITTLIVIDLTVCPVLAAHDRNTQPSPPPLVGVR